MYTDRVGRAVGGGLPNHTVSMMKSVGTCAPGRESSSASVRRSILVGMACR
jgi:hypothetical protein